MNPSSFIDYSISKCVVISDKAQKSQSKICKFFLKVDAKKSHPKLSLTNCSFFATNGSLLNEEKSFASFR